MPLPIVNIPEPQRTAIVVELQGINDEIDRLLHHGEYNSPRIRALFATRQSLQQRWVEQAERTLAATRRSV